MLDKSWFEYRDKSHNDILLDECNTPEKTKIFKDFINKYHSYVKYKLVPQRRINWLIYNKNAEVIGVIGISSCVLCVKDRDLWIGWDKDVRIQNSNCMANNYRFCLKPDTGIKNLGSRVLKMIRIEGAKRWKERYGDDLLLLETYVLKSENRRGAVYLADNWIHVGQTSGVSIKKAPIKHWLNGGSGATPLARLDIEAAIRKYGPKDENGIGRRMIISESEPKMIFVKPLVKDWKVKLNIK
jgi:hypothetical protein